METLIYFQIEDVARCNEALGNLFKYIEIVLMAFYITILSWVPMSNLH